MTAAFVADPDTEFPILPTEQWTQWKQTLPDIEDRLKDIQTKKDTLQQQEAAIRRSRQDQCWAQLCSYRQNTRLEFLHGSPDWLAWNGFLSCCSLGRLDSGLLHRFLVRWDCFSLFSENSVVWLSRSEDHERFLEMQKEYQKLVGLSSTGPPLWSHYKESSKELDIFIVFFTKASEADRQRADSFCRQLQRMLVLQTAS